MIVKMNLISLTGPVQDLDRVVSEYLSKYEIHMENAMTELGDVKNLVPFRETNPYRAPLEKLSEFTDFLNEKGTGTSSQFVPKEDAIALINRLDERVKDLKTKRVRALEEIREIEERMEKIEPFRSLPEDIPTLLSYRYVQFRFGRIPKDFYEKLTSYVYDNFDTVFYPSKTDDRYVWGIYFVPRSERHKIDAVYTSMHFERIYIPAECTGTPEENYQKEAKALQEKKAEAAAYDLKIKEILEQDRDALLGAKEEMTRGSEYFDIRKMSAIVRHEHDDYYILCGWMSHRDVKKLKKEILSDDQVVLVIEDTETERRDLKPPTKLKNPALFRPYEMYVSMYGLPNYKELDPTVFIALTYSLIFGAMYGDWGQGLVLLICGSLLYHFKKIPLAGIIACAGFFSTIFGVLFGSFFGFEGVPFHALWLYPQEEKMMLPGIGSINTVLVVAIVFGMVMILVTMLINIINSKRLGDREGMLFGTNSLTGFLFYAGVMLAVFTAFGKTPIRIGAIFVVFFFVIPLGIMLLKEPLTHMVERRKGRAIEGGVGMFLVQGFFELFETMLSFFSNTLSFVRIGAFAVSHAAMMQVVLMLAGAHDGGNTNWLVVILGNLFVMGMEGLIVGIQVLRLEYYEMFSRFYRGDGRPFRPYFQKKS